MQNPPNAMHWSTSAMLVWCSIVATSFVTLQPTFVGMMMDQLGVSHAGAGYTSSALLLGGALGSLLLHKIGARYELREFICASGCLLLAVELACAFVLQGYGLLALRLLHSLAVGVLLGSVNALASRAEHPARLFAGMLTAQLCFGAIGHYLLPALSEHGGLSALFLALGALTLPVAIGSRLLAPGVRLPSAAAGRPRLPDPTILRIFGSLLLMYAGYMAVWTYLERIGIHAHLTAETVRITLSAGMLAGLAGGVLAWILARRADATRMIHIGLAALAAGTFALLFEGEAAYVFATITSNAAQVFVVPFYLGLLAARDDRERVIVLVGPVISAGLILGPLLGAIFGGPPNYVPMIAGSALLVLLASLAMSAGARAPAPAPPAARPQGRARS